MATHRARRWSLGGLATLLSAALASAVLFTASDSATHRADAATTAVTWSDEFDGPAGSLPSAAKWTLETGGGGFGNHELEYYTNRPDNVSLDGAGHLVITARKNTDTSLTCWYGPCQYTSARLNTARTFTQKYGRIEARIKVPRGQGMWPAFWMLGDDLGSAGWPASGEIDIMENVGYEPGTVHGTLHGPGYSGGGAASGPRTRSRTARPSPTTSMSSPSTGALPRSAGPSTAAPTRPVRPLMWAATSGSTTTRSSSC
ncbi:hypothetical protein GCM10020256_24310 [Streptomyces thermocoprophilus]